jgi:ribonuclease HII
MFKEIKKLHKQGYKRIVGIDEAGRGPLAGPVVAGAVVYFFPSLRGAEATKQSCGKLTKSPRSAPYGAGLAMTFGKIRDSKKLSAKQREEWYEILTQHLNIQWGIGIVSEKIIDKINILQATKLAMAKAVKDLEKKLGQPADFLIIDGNFIISVMWKTYGSSVFEDASEDGLRIRPKSVFGREKRRTLAQKAIARGDEKIFLCAAASIIAKVTRDRIMMKMHKKYPQYGFDKHKGYGTREHLRALRKYGASKIHRKSFGPVKKAKKGLK